MTSSETATGFASIGDPGYKIPQLDHGASPR